jgi:arylsulfatase A-like enzyme
MFLKRLIFAFVLFCPGFFQACAPADPPSGVSDDTPTIQRLTNVSGRAPVWNWDKPVKPLFASHEKPNHVYQVELQDINKNALILFRNDVFHHTLDNPRNGRLEFWGAGFVASDEEFPKEILVQVTMRNEHKDLSELFPLNVSQSSEQPWQRFDFQLLDMSGPVDCDIRLVLSDPDTHRNDLYAAIGSPVFIPDVRQSVPNVVIICLDSLRSDDLGCYGSPLANSPTMDMLARKGVLYSNSLSSSSWTVPGVKNFLLGKYSWFDQIETDQIPEISNSADLMIQDYFARAGYYTAAVMGNPLITPSLGFERGFDVFNMFPVRTWYEGAAEEVYGQIIHTIESYHDRPLFLYIHIMDPHDPYVPSEPFSKMNNPPSDHDVRPFFRQKLSGQLNMQSHRDELVPLADQEDNYLRSHYRSSIREVDTILHLVLNSLHDHTDFPDNTLLIITSDHGEEFGEHGYYQHGMSLYESSVNVPWIMMFPSAITTNHVIDGWVSNIDIPATLSDLTLQVENPSWDGDIVYPERSELFESRHVFTAVRSRDEPSVPRTRWRAVYQGDRKLMWSPSRVTGYDLAVHPEEIPIFEYSDFSRFEANTTDNDWLQMGEELQAFMKRLVKREKPEVSEILTKQLRELGYLQ